MKNYPTQKILIFLFTIAFVLSCNKPELTDSLKPITKINSPSLLKISFDAEVLKFQEIEDASKASVHV